MAIIRRGFSIKAGLDFLLIGHAVCWWGEGKTPEISLFQVPGSVKDGYVVTQCQWQKGGAIVIEMENCLCPWDQCLLTS